MSPGKEMGKENNSNQDVIIRRSAVGDAAEIANVHLNSWREAYKTILPENFLNDLPLTFKRRKSWWEKCLSEPDQHVIIVAESNSGIVGFASFQNARDKEFLGFAELSAIYMFEKFKGRGLGFQMLNQGMQTMKKRNFEKCYCWVLKNNPTIKFYEKTGAKFNELVKQDKIGEQVVEEFCYVWDYLLD